MKKVKLMMMTLMMSLCFNSFSQSDTIFVNTYVNDGGFYNTRKIVVDEITMVDYKYIYFKSLDGTIGYLKRRSQADGNTTTYYSRNGVIEYNNTITPGNELLIASNRFNLGVILIGTGSSLAIVSSVALDARKPMLIAGSLMSLIGTVLIIESHQHIKRAGLLLNGNGVGVKVKI